MMRRTTSGGWARRLTLMCIVAAGLPLEGVAAAPAASLADGEDGSGGKVPKCMTVSQRSDFKAYGYDHVVVLSSQCQAVARCAVSSNLDDRTVSVDVPTRERREVLLARSSPARTFEPSVVCTLSE